MPRPCGRPFSHSPKYSPPSSHRNTSSPSSTGATNSSRERAPPCPSVPGSSSFAKDPYISTQVQSRIERRPSYKCILHAQCTAKKTPTNWRHLNHIVLPVSVLALSMRARGESWKPILSHRNCELVSCGANLGDKRRSNTALIRSRLWISGRRVHRSLHHHVTVMAKV